MVERLHRIREKVAINGATLGPILTEPEVLVFEHRHGVSLPDGYRHFLLNVGNGGDGPPDSGLVPLGCGPKSTYKPEVSYWEELPDIRRPFPFTKPHSWEGNGPSEEGTSMQTRYGCLFLGEEGCGVDWLLVVTGPERGNVWLVCPTGIAPHRPRLDFLDWYEGWLDGKQDRFI